MKQIDINNKIFQSDEYLKDKYRFHLITLNLKSESVVLYSDEENYVICRGVVGLPTWIWTKDNFDVTKLDEIMQAIELYLTEGEKDKFTCKKELYDLLINVGFDKINSEDYFEMGTLFCKQTRKPRECDGKLSVPRMDEKDILTKYWFDSNHEMRDVTLITMEEAENRIQEMLESNRFYVWRNDDNKVVSMADYTEVDGEAKIGHVYTPTEERGKGYAANLICDMTNELLEKGYVPLLYTDYNYPPSNKAYINAGYENTGILINFSCSKVKNRFKRD